MSTAPVVRYPSGMDDDLDYDNVRLSAEGAQDMIDGVLPEDEEQAIILRAIWSAEMQELEPPTERDLENLLRSYRETLMTKMLFDMLLRGDLMVYPIQGEPDNFVWVPTAQGIEKMATYDG